MNHINGVQISYDDSSDPHFSKKKIHKRYWTNEEVSFTLNLNINLSNFGARMMTHNHHIHFKPENA